MWMVVREDPTGRLRYQYHSAHSFNPDDCYRFSRGCRSFPDPMYSCSPQPTYSDHHGEVEQYDNVSPDSPVPIYHQIYSAPITGSYIYSSPSTSSSEYQESSVYRDMRYVRRPSYPREIVSPVSSIPNSDSFYYYSRKEPRCPSPDYSPPLRNRVRFQLPDSPVSEGHFVSSLVGEREPRQPVDEDRHISSLEPFSLDPDPSSYSLLRTVNSYNEDSRLESSSCGNEQTPKKSSSSSKLFKNRLFRKSGNKGSAPLPPLSSPYTPSSVRTPSIPLSGGVTPLGTMPHTDKASSSIGSSLFRKDKGKKKGKNKIRKEDISNPTNFQHKAHVGWDQDSGFSNNVFDSDPMDESIRDIIRAAGQDPTNMSKKTMKFVYDFIDKYQAEESTETPVPQASYKTPPPAIPVSQPTISQWSQPTPPPPPSRLSSHQSSQPPARPPPPPPSYIDSSNRAARPLPQVPSLPSQVDTNRPAVVPPPPPPPPPAAPAYNNSSSIPPPPPPPPVLSGSSGAVPPPPPPPTCLLKDLPAPQSGRSNLLAEIQAGKKLKSVGEPGEKAGAPNARGDMMAQIRQGTQLKHVDKMSEEERRKSAAPLSDMGGIAGALAKALEERRVNLGIDDSSDEEDSDDKNEWSD